MSLEASMVAADFRLQEWVNGNILAARVAFLLGVAFTILCLQNRVWAELI